MKCVCGNNIRLISSLSQRACMRGGWLCYSHGALEGKRLTVTPSDANRFMFSMCLKVCVVRICFTC